ncbi:GPI transamidase component Gpi16p [[Candida] jaroonii]|uniref:GPI transamidase component Gpi16p n=1 Tax=[Candida] jaroonii TaxID=467808 RepID=A0ACA9Y615_9ASCO|nr:GPI transamidase component Gpi16p [[Candida] jaroonii]
MNFWVFLSLLWVSLAHQYYNESLEITPLPRNNLLAQFEFEVKSLPQEIKYHENGTESSTTHYTYFPRSVGPLLENSNTRELHLRFTQGWWDAELWGKVPSDGKKSGGTGVELWAIIEAPSSSQALKHWYKLSKSLSGFFCASLNFIDDSITTFPLSSFAEESFKADEANKLFLIRAALPSEPICTENLTPFLKLLPTRGKAGVSSLLDGHKIFDSLWHSMSIDIKTQCVDDVCNYQMDQSIYAIIDVPRCLRKHEEGAIAKPIQGENLRCDTTKDHDIWKCFPLGLPTELNYDLETIFGRPIRGSCFTDEVSPVKVNFKDGWKIDIKEGLNINTLSSDHPIYEIKGTKPVNIDFNISNTTNIPKIEAAPLIVSRSLTGYSQDKGGFRVSFTNTQDNEVKFIYFESLPWFTRLYLNTLRATVDGKEVDFSDYVHLKHYLPAIDRKRPSHMELEVIIPAHKTLILNYKFDKSLLLYAEYPPDANHGFSVEPAVITVFNDSGKLFELRTTSSLITLPTPDFSMPYNVIILTGTVMSLAFGSVVNLLIKDIITEEEYEKLAAQGKLQKLIAKIRFRIKFVVTTIKNIIFNVKSLIASLVRK